jgi:outer membrane protein
MKRFALIVFVSILAAVVQAQAQAPAGTTAAPSAAGQKAPAAPSAPPVPGNKVAVIDFRSALMDSDPGKAAQQQYEKEIAGERAKVDKLQKEYDELQAKLQSAKTDTEKSNLNRDIQTKTRDAQRAADDAQQLSQELQDRLLPPVAAMVNKAVDEYAKENNLAIVLDPRTDPTNIIYSSIALDITSEIMRRMNAEYAKNPKIAAPAAAPAAPATK